MIVVTGGAGFIGSAVLRALNAQGRDDLVVVDDLTDGTKFRNLVDTRIADYWDHAACLERLARSDAPEAIIHQGACSDTTSWDGRSMLQNNYEFSKRLLDYAQGKRVPFIYASSAAVYGPGGSGAAAFEESAQCEAPLNVYGYSKLLFDQLVRRRIGRGTAQVAGLRYFNVYGPGEAHKGPMASVAWQFHRQALAEGVVRLFEGSAGYADGEQRRDFVYVDDVAEVVLWFLEHPDRSGIFNVGTGKAQTFNEVAQAVIACLGRGRIEYVPFPPDLEGCYQAFTEARLDALRAAGCPVRFRSVRDGVRRYMEWLTRPRA